jgi:hypothetical protein
MADSKPIKQEVNGTVILSPLVFPAESKELIQEQLFLMGHKMCQGEVIKWSTI